MYLLPGHLNLLRSPVDDVVSPGCKKGLEGGNRTYWGCGMLHAQYRNYPWWSGTAVMNASVKAELGLGKMPELWVRAVSVTCPLGMKPPSSWVLVGTQ